MKDDLRGRTVRVLDILAQAFEKIRVELASEPTPAPPPPKVLGRCSWPGCRKELRGRRNRRYCTVTCRMRARRARAGATVLGWRWEGGGWVEVVETRACLACGRVLVGRADRKFCDGGCRRRFRAGVRI